MEPTLEALAQQVRDELGGTDSGWRVEGTVAGDGRLGIVISSARFEGEAMMWIGDPRPDFIGLVSGSPSPSVSDWVAEVWEYIDEGLATRSIRFSPDAAPHPELTFEG